MQLNKASTLMLYG